MKIAISIKNYERKMMLINLLSEINKFIKKNHSHEVLVSIWDDKSNFSEKFLNSLADKYSVNQPEEHLGKEKHWKLWNFNLYNDSFKKDVDLFVYLPSDASEVNFNKIISLAEKFKDEEYVFNISNDGRTKCWNNNEMIPINNDYSQVFFTDCTFFSNRKTLDKLGWYVSEVPMSRFRRKGISTGVGQQLTERLNDLQIKIYHPKTSLFYHGDHESTMHHEERKKNPLMTVSALNITKPIVIGIATFEGREKALEKCLESLSNQSIKYDSLFVYDNSKEDIDLTDNGKFEPLSRIDYPCYYLSCDDDLIYPYTYIEDMIRAIQTHKSIVTHHGRKLVGIKRNYYGGHKQFGCLRHVRGVHEIDIAGTGVTAFDTEYFFPAEIYKSPFKRMSDCIFSLEATKQKKKIIVLPHPQGYIKQIPVDETKSCFGTERKNPKIQNSIADEIFTLKHSK